jgi:colanic acid biosynthesis glycosyl transferase WcaI
MTEPLPLRLIVLCPHFDPDTAPTGRVMTRIVTELAARGHRIDVVTSLPWYRAHRVEPGWTGRLARIERKAWGTIRRLHPFPGGDKRDLVRRVLGFLGFSALAGWAGLGAGGWFRRADAVIAMSPPLTMGVTGRLVAWSHRAPLVFNVQDVFPDAAVTTGAITNRGVIAFARVLERISYCLADAVTVLSDDLRANVAAKLPRTRAATVRTIPNFVDIDRIHPADRMTTYRAELGLGAEPVLLYAGNVGFSQSVELLVEAARRLPGISVVINGEGVALDDVRRSAAGLTNVRFAAYLPEERLGELLATGDVHAIPLRSGLAAVSVPSKTYSSLAAGRPIVAAIDPGTVVPKILDEAGAGIAVPPEDADRFAAAVDELTSDLDRARRMGERGRAWVLRAASPAAVASAYEALVSGLSRRRT